ncbi:BMP family ABC transporter substrate-binding protein [uncultured Clostridium sp.]|uniref:BMP family ABC transporter substrate-binding protein n=1 Tax=uncultured Clostridium sp. TaxID=59620 RepID=UPI0025CE22E4|nr:BMP family ABC transporter substrate-binding protein [uncultured Clostridium sp.]
MKKAISTLLALSMAALMLIGCGSGGATGGSSTEDKNASTEASKIKVGVIYIGDENEGYTEAHMKGISEMKKSLGLADNQIIEKKSIPEDEKCYDAAVDLAEEGCNIIFSNSFGHEDYIIQAAKEYPEIQFCHATGFQAATSGLSNMHNYFTSVYESRYVSGVVAGLKLNKMIEDGTITKDKCKVGYVGAYPYAEVVSGYTAFYLGIKSVCDAATMEVQYTNSWASMDLEKSTAEALIADGCVLISQHADTTGAPTACEAAGVPVVGYNVSMIATAPKTALTSASINWGPYYTYAVKCVMEGKSIDTDWCQGYSEGADCITELNKDVVAPGTEEKVAEVENAIKNGSLHVFDTSKFTVNGSSLEDLIKSDENYKKYANFVSDGYYHESEKTSAPSFDIRIDGITELTKSN